MQRKTIITILLSVIFTLVLTLGMVAVPATVTLADQTVEILAESVNTKHSMEMQKNQEKLVNQRKNKRKQTPSRKAKEKDLAPLPPKIQGGIEQCTCNCGLGANSGSLSGKKCVCIVGCR